MKLIKKYTIYTIVLIALTFIIYIIEFYIFKNPRDIEFSFMSNLAFLPVQVLLITLLLEGISEYREKKKLLSKLNLIIGVFFSELGIKLFRNLMSFDLEKKELKKSVFHNTSWSHKDFKKAALTMIKKDYKIDCRSSDINSLKELLTEKNSFLTNLLSNSNLLEHDSFTDLLFALFHLSDELHLMDKIKVKDKDYYDHISKDMERVYRLLTYHFILYAEYIKGSYPYLYKNIESNMN